MTDSNFLNYGPILDFVKKHVVPFKLFKKSESASRYDVKLLNILSTFTSYAIAETLWNYLDHVNVAEEDRQYIKMKNEFFYRRIIVTYAKKSYIALLSRKEAHIYPKPKIDVKGVNFFKSTASKKTSDFIYDKVLMKQLLDPEDGNISLRRTYKTIYDFQQRIREEIKEGDMGYLKRSIKVKSPDAYANPYRISQYKAVYVWNYVNEDEDRIELPATTTTVKVRLRTKKDVAALAPWPKIYRKMIELFDTNPEIGDHIEVKDGKERKVKGKGINAIALPNEYDDVPDWVLAIIDDDTLVSDNMKLFGQIFRPLGLSEQTVNINGNSAVYFTNVVRL